GWGGPCADTRRRSGPTAGPGGKGPADRRPTPPLSTPRGGPPPGGPRAAAVISESIGIPPHLSLPPVRSAALNLSHDRHATRKEETHERTKNRRKSRAGDRRQPRPRSRIDGGPPGPWRKEGVRDGAPPAGAARAA